MEIVMAPSIAKQRRAAGFALAIGAATAGLPVQSAYAQAAGAGMTEPCSIPLSRSLRRTCSQDRQTWTRQPIFDRHYSVEREFR
jgi:hypothetical protein